MKLRNSIAAYFALQSAAVVAWWVALHENPGLIPLFRSADSSDSAILNLWLADLAMIAGGSAVAAAAIAKNLSFRIPGIWTLAGAILYATLLTLGSSLRSSGGWLAVALMGSAAIMTMACAISETRR
jgi:hypothetical protein